MCISSYGCCLSLVAALGAVWFAVLCGERGWFRNAFAGWIAMSPVTRVALAVLCAYCTVVAQKPSSQTSGGTNTPQTATPPSAGATRLSASADIVAEAEGEDGVLSATQSGARAASAAQSRVVLQSALASDPSAVAVFAGEPGWLAPAAVTAARGLNALSFDGAGPDIPSPVCFTNAAGVSAQTFLLAVRGSAADLATLADAPETARIRLAAEGCPEPDMTAAERALTGSLTPGQWQVAEVGLDRPAALSAVFFGGSAGRPEWLRNWRGEIAEAVAFNVTPDEDARAGVANHLAIRWGCRGCSASPAQRAAAVAAGLRGRRCLS